MGLFISLDGIDGGGKSTQIQLLAEWFERHGRSALTIRDPGGTRLGEALREILLHKQDIPLSMNAEMLLYMASRAELVSSVIRPALQAGKVVLADRYLLANVVYQGTAGGLDVERIWQVGSVATDGLMPDLTCVLDLPVSTAFNRIGRSLDRLESRGPEYLERVRAGFLEQSQRLGANCIVVDASAEPRQVHAKIVEALLSRGWGTPDAAKH